MPASLIPASPAVTLEGLNEIIEAVYQSPNWRQRLLRVQSRLLAEYPLRWLPIIEKLRRVAMQLGWRVKSFPPSADCVCYAAYFESEGRRSELFLHVYCSGLAPVCLFEAFGVRGEEVFDDPAELDAEVVTQACVSQLAREAYGVVSRGGWSFVVTEELAQRVVAQVEMHYRDPGTAQVRDLLFTPLV